jgi:hypothetical protein
MLCHEVLSQMGTLVSDGPGRTPVDDRPTATDRHALPLDRFNAFSDGVFAIAITLLVLEITVPREGVPLWHALSAQWPEFLGYYISFAFIGGIWITHSGVTKYMRRGDSVVYTLNLVLLLLVGLLPFAVADAIGMKWLAVFAREEVAPRTLSVRTGRMDRALGTDAAATAG